MNYKSLACILFALFPGLTLANEMPKNQKIIMGLYEEASIADLDLHVKAKLDTGAQTASLSARDIRRFKRNGESWVEFYLAIDEAHDNKIQLPLARISKIKRRADDLDEEDDKSYSARPVVELSVCIGQQRQMIEVNLTDRSSFKYPLLIGSKALKKFKALVDVSDQFVAGQPKCPHSDSTALITE